MKLCSDLKSLDSQPQIGRPKTMNSGAMFQAIEPNPASSIWRVSGKLSISPYGLLPS